MKETEKKEEEKRVIECETTLLLLSTFKDHLHKLHIQSTKQLALHTRLALSFIRSHSLTLPAAFNSFLGNRRYT